MDAITEFLRDFPADNGFSRDAFLLMVQEMDWSYPDAVSQLRIQVRKRADDAIAAWGMLSRVQECSSPTAVRNLIAASEKNDLGIYAILLRYEQKISTSSLGNHLREILALLPYPDAELSIVRTLLLTERKPTIGAYSKVLHEHPESLFLARFWTALGENGASEEILADVFQKAVAGPLKSEGESCAQAMVKLLKQNNWDPFISQPLLGHLPTSVRRAIFNKSTLLTAELQNLLRDNPYFNSDAPAVLARDKVLSSALIHIKEKDFSHEMVARLVEDRELFSSNIKKIRAAVRATPSYWSTPTAGSTRLVRALHNLSDLPEALVLLIHSVPLTRRHKVLLKARRGVARKAAPLCTVKMLAEILAKTTGKDARACILELLDDPGIRYSVLKQCFTDQYFDSPIKYRDLREEWFRTAISEDMVRTIVVHGSVMPAFSDMRKGDQEFLDILEATYKKLQPAVVIKLLTPTRRNRYLKCNSYHADELIHAMVDQLCKKETVTEWIRPESFSQFVKWFPSSAPRVLRFKPTDWAFRIICETPKVWSLGDGDIERLMRQKNINNELLWKKYLEKWTLKRRPVPSALRRYIETRPKLLAQAFDLVPTVFWKSVRTRYPLEKLLEAAFRYPKLAVDLEKHVPREKLRAKISWIQSHWKDKPTLAAAYEVAASFSLPDAGLLVWLGKKLRAPFDPELRGKAFDDHYRTYELPKKSGGNRIITVPSNALKRLQRRLLDNGFNEIDLHSAAMGFRRGRSIRDNAEQHTRKKVVANVDIHQFFPSTRYDLILRACRKLRDGNISPRAARLVAEVCSFQGALPTGAPTSPAIANIVLRAADKAIGTVANNIGVTYTRYADDLTFSGDEGAVTILPFVREVLEQQGYKLDKNKTNLYRRGRRQLVTGLVVNDKPNIPRRARRKLRAAVHRRISGGEPYWHDKPISDSVLLGHLAFLYLTQPEEANHYRECLYEVLST